ncbi:MAG: hypothetical protein FD180_1951 [Planctomycetota bacterium]|nr:MAG: hypothetical protein FD180_1951 [Planctomycetota bacterium]
MKLRPLSFLAILVVFGSVAKSEDADPKSSDPSGEALGPFGAPGSEARFRALIADALRNPPADEPGAMALPSDFPQFIRRGSSLANMSADEPQVVLLWVANSELLKKAGACSASSVRAEFSRRMNQEKESPALRLIYAEIASGAGSEEAALEILASMKSTSYETVRNTHAVLAGLLWTHRDASPAWVVELAMAAVADDRPFTDKDTSGWSRNIEFSVAYLAAEHSGLLNALGQSKCQQAVPLLIERVKKTDASRKYVMALADLGDKRAIPVLVEHLSRLIKDLDEPFDRRDRLIWALARLGATEVVPLLIDHLEYPKSIEALELLGDARALAPIKKLIEDKGVVIRDGKPIAKYDEQERLGRAMIAAAMLEPGDRVPRLCSLLQDSTLDEFQHSHVVWCLRDTADGRAVPFLMRDIRADKDGSRLFWCVSALSAFRCKEAVDGLIECLEMDFDGMKTDKVIRGPETFRAQAVEGLKTLTGQQLPADARQWKTWWSENREKFRFEEKPR